ncbi:MAG: DNA methyltransferase [Candidatus Hodarchaeota archaeon]
MNKEVKKLLANDIHSAKAILRNINWNFYQRSAFAPYEVYPFNCRKHHWFPATFVPEIPFTLVEVLTHPNAVVYDPFAGIGTTYFQALLLNRKPLATEICRVAIEYMRSLFTLFKPDINFDRLKSKIEKILATFNGRKDYTLDVPKHVLIDRLQPWYSESTLNQLCFLFNREAASRDATIKAAMRISLSAILKTVSSQNRGWGCIADNMLPKKAQIKDKGVFDLFRKQMNGMLDDISGHLNCVMQGYDNIYKELSVQQTIFYEDVRECRNIPNNSVDLVITSPPYPNMTDYVTSQRLSYYFFGFDLIEKNGVKDLALEIGARSRRSRIDSIDRYFEDMQQANKAISAKIKQGGFACYVLPVFNTDNENNRSRRRIVQKVLSSMDQYDLIKEDEYERILPSKRRSHNIKWATLEREKIYLFKKA